VKQNESNGDPEFTMPIGFGGKPTSYWNINKRQSWKWRGICRAYRNSILKFDVGQMSFKNRGKACGAQVVSTTRGGTVWNVDLGSSIIDNDLHEERCNQLLTQMNVCSIFLRRNLWFEIEKIKMEQGFM